MKRKKEEELVDNGCNRARIETKDECATSWSNVGRISLFSPAKKMTFSSFTYETIRLV